MCFEYLELRLAHIDCVKRLKKRISCCVRMARFLRQLSQLSVRNKKLKSPTVKANPVLTVTQSITKTLLKRVWYPRNRRSTWIGKDWSGGREWWETFGTRNSTPGPCCTYQPERVFLSKTTFPFKRWILFFHVEQIKLVEEMSRSRWNGSARSASYWQAIIDKRTVCTCKYICTFWTKRQDEEKCL